MNREAESRKGNVTKLGSLDTEMSPFFKTKSLKLFA